MSKKTNRVLDVATLDGAAAHLAAAFLQPDMAHPRLAGRFLAGPGYVGQELYNFTFADEFDHVVAAVRAQLGAAPLQRFEKLAKDRFEPRDGDLFAQLLEEKLAVRPDGTHVERKIGRTVVGQRFMGLRAVEVETPDSIRRRKRLGLPLHAPDRSDREVMTVLRPHFWPIYAGENEERIAAVHAELAGRSYDRVFHELPAGTPPNAVGATVTKIANVAAIAACDAIVDLLDGGTGAAVLQGRTGTQPADPDTTTSGTNLFTLVCSDPAFGAAADNTGKATATADAITDDSSADATGTLGYVRASSTNDGATPLDDLIDGEAGTSGADFNFSTLSIVSGATISMSSWTFSVPEGA